MAAANSVPLLITSVPLSDTERFNAGATYIVRYGETGQFTSFPIICYPDKLIIGYTNAHHMAVFSNAKAAMRYINPNNHSDVMQQYPPYGVMAIYRLQLPAL